MIKGWLYLPGSSARSSAELSALGDHFTVTIDGGASVSGAVVDLDISHRVGNITRRIVLPDQSLFETEDNDGVDRFLREFGSGKRLTGMLHGLETSWRWIGIAFLTTLLVIFSMVYWGLPWASKEIAFSLPPSVMDTISHQTMEILDSGFLDPSELPSEKQKSIREHTEKMFRAMQERGFSYQLQFRKMGDMPNAFALPSGTIIVTDRLVELADSQDEIDAVIFHEIGHVVRRHALERVLHSSFMTVVIIMVTGDVTAINNLAVALPVFLVKSRYSRENEAEADKFAFEKMMQVGIDPDNFAKIMDKISSAYELKDKDDGKEKSKEKDKDKAGNPPEKTLARDNAQKGKRDRIMQYLSTHPPTPERIQQAKEYSERYKKERLGAP